MTLCPVNGAQCCCQPDEGCECIALPEEFREETRMLRKNAERYQWLREEVWSGGRATCDILRPKGRWANSIMTHTAEELDAAIDAWISVSD